MHLCCPVINSEVAYRMLKHSLSKISLDSLLYLYYNLLSVCQRSQTAGRNSCSIVSGNVSNCSHRLTVHPVTSSRLNSAYHFFYTRKTLIKLSRRAVLEQVSIECPATAVSRPTVMVECRRTADNRDMTNHTCRYPRPIKTATMTVYAFTA